MILEIKDKDLIDIEINDEEMKRIKKIRLINCEDTYDILSRFINLISLTLYNCNIKEIPRHLIKLEELNIIYDDDYKKNEINEIPKTLKRLRKIKIKSKNIKINKEDYKKLEEYEIK